MRYNMSRKIIVDVTARFDTQGHLTPLSLTWEDGTVYAIDAVLDVRRAASLKAGGMGIRYTVSISGKKRYLYYEQPKWFVEGKESSCADDTPCSPTRNSWKS